MSNLALRVEDLGKMYRIGRKRERYVTLRDTLTDAMAAPFKRARSIMHGEAYGAANLKEEIWALKDVSFNVKHGEAVGIIGRNGAGKSTLLKVLSRITEPTEGYAEVFGRVGSLLEVGTGFHPELTGRENIYLNGAILGMPHTEIDRKFDEIVDFAEVEKFIDTPVKHYSSGMGLRLGFAVAAHLEPEILVVDEVLAVGDADFQKKCLGKMSDVAGEGRTVLFVSHNMAAMQNLCENAVLLNHGSIVFAGTAENTVNYYLNSMQDSATAWSPIEHENMIVEQIAVSQGDRIGEFDPKLPVRIEVKLQVYTSTDNILLGFDIVTEDGILLSRTYAPQFSGTGRTKPGHYNIVFELPAGVLNQSIYYLEFLLAIHRMGWISRGQVSKKLSFSRSKQVISEVTYPGILRSFGNWCTSHTEQKFEVD